MSDLRLSPLRGVGCEQRGGRPLKPIPIPSRLPTANYARGDDQEAQSFDHGETIPRACRPELNDGNASLP